MVGGFVVEGHFVVECSVGYFVVGGSRLKLVGYSSFLEYEGKMIGMW